MFVEYRHIKIPLIPTGVLLLMFAGIGYRNSYLLYYRGIDAKGVVTSTLYDKSSLRNPAYRAQFSFKVPNGEIYHADDPIDWESYKNLKAGDSIAIRYVVDDPSISETGDSSQDIGFMLFELLLASSSLGMILYGIFRKYNRRKRISGR